MDEKKSDLIGELQICHLFLVDLAGAYLRQNSLERKQSELKRELEEWQGYKESGKNPKDRGKLYGGILFFPIIYGLSAIFSPIIFNFVDESSGVAVVAAMVVLVAAIFLSVLTSKYISKRSNKQFWEEVEEGIKHCQETLPRLNADAKANEKEIEKLLDSTEAKLVAKVIPPDYCDIDAVEKMIYFLQNGHADTLKEAIHEYDNYVHNQKMEVSAARQAEAAEATLSYSQQTAEAAQRTARAAEGAEFWALYNAYLNEKR